MTADRISLSVGAAYGMGAFGLMLFNLTVSIFLLYFYTDIVGLSSSTAGYIIFVAMLWDAVTDPLMGIIADRTHTRWGKYRPYLLGGTPFLFFVFIALFFVPDIDPYLVTVYACITTLAYRTLFTVVWMPYTSMIPVLTSDYRQRSYLTGYKTFFVSLGGVFVSSSILFLVRVLGEGDETRGFFLAALAAGGIAWVGIWACFAMTRENDLTGRRRTGETRESYQNRKNNYQIRDAVKASLRNRPFVILFTASFVLLVAWNCLWQTTVYYFKYCIGNAEAAGTALAVFHVLQALTAVLWVYLTARSSKRTVWIAGAAISAAALLILSVVPAPGEIFAITMVGIFGIGTSAFLVTYYSALADTVDFGELKSEIRCEALLFGALSFAAKASFGLASVLVGNALAWIGFEANKQQSTQTLIGIENIFTLFPSLGFIFSILIISFYTIDHTVHADIISELKTRSISDP